MVAVFLQLSFFYSYTQCAIGSTNVSLNWDALDYILTTGYSNSVATALSPNQYFAFGRNRLNIAYSTTTSLGENTINVDVVGSVTSVTMTITASGTINGGSPDNNFWLSDISACQATTFPINYYQISQPFTGQPGYVLVAANKSVYMVNPATGAATFIFSDGSTSGTINSLAYDPYNKIIYFCHSLTNNGSANASERTLRKYDMNTGMTTTLLNDVTSLGIPTFDQGVESGAAAFYDGALYIGIEGGADGSGGGPKVNTNKESIIWRLDFTAGVPTRAIQVYAVSGDTHDWSDFSINDGMLYDANGDAATPDYHHFNMQTGGNTLVNYVAALPKQTATGWDGTIYRVTNTIAQYNMAGGVGMQYNITANPAIPNFGSSGAPSFGDAAEAFRPKVDFGDAPASYDPDALAPALHDIVSNLQIGSILDVEWLKTSSANADADGGDEDGLPYVQLYANGGQYLTEVNVFNNTGANATLCAWADFNNNGIFETGEGITQTIASSTTTQTVSLYWTGITDILPDNTYTYLRIRISSAINGMTAANATGYFSDGEVEDHRILVTFDPLAVKVADFIVQKLNEEQVKIKWTSINDEINTNYEVQRSADGRTG